MRRALVLAGTAVVLLAGTAGAADAAPYSDPAVSGALALCDPQGRLVTGGPLRDEPFAAKVVSDFVAPAPYRGREAKVTVLVFQPRRGVAPGAWSGEPLTASSSFTDPAHPSAEVTWGDVTLKQAAEDYPPQWDGLLQLRLYTGAPNQPLYRQRYAAADVRISAGRWQLVHPVSLPCSSGRAVSVARALAPATVDSPAPSARGTAPARAVTAAPTTSPVTAATGEPVPSAGPADGSALAAGKTSSRRSWPVLSFLLGGLIVVLSGAVVRRRLNAR